MSNSKIKQDILLGNEAMGRGLVEAGVHFVTAYPGTPSSEILPSVVKYAPELDPPPYVEWSINEKVAVETALSASYTGKRSAAIMKQVGLNVALDPVMSSSYIGVKGGFVIISADDPGPHSSQTEQDSRMLAHFAKLPVLDPDSPAQARDLMAQAFAISEKFEIPVMVRPTLRVCHARQNLELKTPKPVSRPAEFEKDPFRWAAIPKMRLALHEALNAKLDKIAAYASGRKSLNIWHSPARKGARLGILASGVSAAMALDLIREMGLDLGRIPFLQTVMPYPLPRQQVRLLLDSCQKVLVLEETEPLLEILSPERKTLLGRLSGHVPSAGELSPDRMAGVLLKALKEARLSLPKPKGEPIKIAEEPPLRRPNLCPGCSHRAVFYTLRKAFPTGIYPSDIGCYTLGMNQGAVDTCHDMGASITFAAALSRAHRMDGIEKPVIATIGDSTFFHSGTTGLLNAVHNGSRFVLVVLDNETTSMTGMQPTPESGLTADGHPGREIDLLGLIKGCGVQRIYEVDPYNLTKLKDTLKDAWDYASRPDGSVAVVVARHACVAQRKDDAIPNPVRVEAHKDKCISCGICTTMFSCPALKPDAEGKVDIDRAWCVDCGLCVEVCPKGALLPVEEAK